MKCATYLKLHCLASNRNTHLRRFVQTINNITSKCRVEILNLKLYTSCEIVVRFLLGKLLSGSLIYKATCFCFGAIHFV